MNCGRHPKVELVENLEAGEGKLWCGACLGEAGNAAKLAIWADGMAITARGCIAPALMPPKLAEALENLVISALQVKHLAATHKAAISNGAGVRLGG